jgi:hypothetical protein
VNLEDKTDLLQPQPAKIVPQPFAIENNVTIKAHVAGRRIEDCGLGNPRVSS